MKSVTLFTFEKSTYLNAILIGRGYSLNITSNAVTKIVICVPSGGSSARRTGKKPGTGNPKIPPHIQDTKLTWYQMRQKAELSTGMSSDDENIYFLQENGFDSIPN
eukprot:13525034-Ditylum_brightwellii.AAC.1